jgi:hypothetical protein
MEPLATWLNLSGSTGIDGDLEDSAAWSRVALPPVEALWLLYANGCVFDAAADEWVPVRFPVPRRHRV